MDKKTCEKCKKIVLSKNFARHLKTCPSVQQRTIEPQRPCVNCGTLITLSNRHRHAKLCSKKRASVEPEPAPKKQRVDAPSTSAVEPSFLNTVRSSVTSAYNTVTSTISNILGPKPALQIVEIEKAFKNRMKTYLIDNRPNIKDPKIFLENSRPLIVNKIREIMQENNYKMNIVLLAEYKKPSNNENIFQQMNFKTKNTIILHTSNIEESTKDKEKKILTEMEEFVTKGSGWTLNKILNLELRINRYVPLRGSSYIELPKKIASKNAVINIQNNDEKCFLWSILAARHTVDSARCPARVHHYAEYEHELDRFLNGIEFPITLDKVKLFEKRSGISINVYSYDEKYIVYPLIVADEEKEDHVDLLYIKDGNKSHYCYIKNLSGLVGSQKTKHEKKIWICRRCLLHFGREDLLRVHREYCKQHDPVKIEMPGEGEKIKFNDFQKSMRVPFAIYADFECMLSPLQTGAPEHTEHTGPYTTKYQKHLAISFSYYIVQHGKEYAKPTTYFGEDAAQVFVNKLLEESKKIEYLYSKEAIKPMEITEEDQATITNASRCHICGKEFTGDDDPLVRDHDHLTGKFRGPAHNSCNRSYRKPRFIPIFIHNLSGYDTHLFIKMFGLNNENIDVIPNNEEKYISYTVHVNGGIELRFLDSLKFMSSSLDALAKNLNPSQFTHMSKFYSGEKLNLLIKKGIYPYDYMDSLEKYNVTSLPNRGDFYNKLIRTHISKQDYAHAGTVWNTFNMKNMKDYTLLYNQSDVLLLADIMENFRDLCMQTYKLDPAWFFTAPGLAWSAMLKTTGVQLELLTDYNMILMIGNGIRGGLSQCSNRHALANNRGMGEEYKPEKPTSYLTYLDANNLYGWAMSQPMPYAHFKWVDDPNRIDVTKVSDDAETGYILEVDLEYPQHLHDIHSDLPLAPQRQAPPGGKQEKLLATLYNKDKYILHYRNLKQYLSLGMKLKKIHRAISFAQSDWLKCYIDLNTEMRTKARNNFEKDFFKLMNNSVFGKTMENIRNRVDIRLATKHKQVDKWLAQPNFKRRTIFTEQLAAVHMSKTKLFFNKAIYVGMSILDISKTLMYDFHYNVIKTRYGDNAQLQYTDTDSLTYLIYTKDLYEDITEKMPRYFDTSDYPPDHKCFSITNKKVIGKFKDELNGKTMYEHIGLRSKMYSIRCEGDEIIKKSKGVKKSIVENEITFQDYRDCLITQKPQYNSMNLIRSYKHDVYSVELNKISLSAHDDKRYILKNDGIITLPWGHYKIPKDDVLEMEIGTALSTE